MSVWTHVCGAIQFDDIARVMQPQPDDYNEEERWLAIHALFRTDIPAGSEGPLECFTRTMDRGPAVLITGDLRDFGQEDIVSIFDWINTRLAALPIGSLIFLRDCAILCRPEDGDAHIIVADNDGETMNQVRIARLEQMNRDAADQGDSEGTA